jgi:hypothetical protein
MEVVGRPGLYLRHDGFRLKFQGLAGAYREHLCPAYTLKLVEPPVGLRDRVTSDQHAVVLHEHNMVFADQAAQALASGQSVRNAGVMVVIGEMAMKESGRLARRQEPIVLQQATKSIEGTGKGMFP